MPHVERRSQLARSGQKNKADLMQSSRPAMARDDLRTAYAGDRNKGPAKNHKVKENGTSNKGRRLRGETDKIPVR